MVVQCMLCICMSISRYVWLHGNWKPMI
uniref:Uncharacterized protein n=1 Tax=Rhizophora mucronata TaxID=61149 RepID=A0A2P2PX23_RHIMU